MFHCREERYLDEKVTKKSESVLKTYIEEPDKTTNNNRILFSFTCGYIFSTTKLDTRCIY